MSPVDSLILDAKKAILEEQQRRFEVLRREGRWEEALHQLTATLYCAADLLTHSSDLLRRVAPRPDTPSDDTHPPDDASINS